MDSPLTKRKVLSKAQAIALNGVGVICAGNHARTQVQRAKERHEAEAQALRSRVAEEESGRRDDEAKAAKIEREREAAVQGEIGRNSIGLGRMKNKRCAKCLYKCII
jgi:hypothetical protein